MKHDRDHFAKGRRGVFRSFLNTHIDESDTTIPGKQSNEGTVTVFNNNRIRVDNIHSSRLPFAQFHLLQRGTSTFEEVEEIKVCTKCLTSMSFSFIIITYSLLTTFIHIVPLSSRQRR